MLDDAAFETFLHKQRPHPPVFGMDGLDGYLTALIIGARFIDPRQWIGLFAGEQALMASSISVSSRSFNAAIRAALSALRTDRRSSALMPRTRSSIR
ncbi:UPF0149 family protein [Mesorhizobium sp.]|uniref:UPF0149 family protein n=1 Tax=Mesorhizobium sp. TaxID=1871066 RepID=UPI00345B8C30